MNRHWIQGELNYIPNRRLRLRVIQLCFLLYIKLTFAARIKVTLKNYKPKPQLLSYLAKIIKKQTTEGNLKTEGLQASVKASRVDISNKIRKSEQLPSLAKNCIIVVRIVILVIKYLFSHF